ncbi:MAG: M6 family metalloprotease domain-containing protein [Gemmatimonadetes bacterium]|nr:MAG: M6 family metalloprotease domain-containing protein [Gemmatimonadota bacterium]
MSAARTLAGALLCAAALAAGVGSAAAQALHDIEGVARARGIELPDAYRRLVERHPGMFDEVRVWRGRAGPAAAPGRAAVSGRFNLIVLPALFADSEEPIFSASEIQQVLFDGPSGTLRRFYLEASGGRLEVVGTVAPWVRTSLTMAEVVGTGFGIGDDARTGEYLAEAIALADSAIDYRLYDNDGPDGIPDSGDDDGVVDAMVFEFQEVAASCGGPAIWPHRTALRFWLGEPVETQDMGANGPIRVDNYIIQGSTDCSGQVLQTANTVTHEFGHILGLPDIYHAIDGIEPQNRRWILGCWAIMAAGSWGCNDGGSRGLNAFGPTGMSPWSRDQLGWETWIEAGDVVEAEFVLPPASTSQAALRVPLDDTGVEELVFEYRPAIGEFDSFLPSSGVLIYHLDAAGVFRPQRGSPTPYRISLLEADGRTDLQRTALNGGNRGEASDAWGILGRTGPLTNATTPGTRRHQGGLPSTVTVHEVRVEDGVARVRLTTTRTPTLPSGAALPDATRLNPYEGRVALIGGGPPYTVSFADAPPVGGLTVAGDDAGIVITGAPDAEGTFTLELSVTDVYGNPGAVSLPLTVGPFTMTRERLVQPFVLFNGATPLSEAEKSALDDLGNADGVFDIGDARAWLLGN